MTQHMRASLNDHFEMVKEAIASATESFAQDEKQLAVRLFSVKTKATHLSAIYEKQIIWKLDSFDELFQKSKRVSKPEIKSALLSTGRPGYRLQMVASLYGDGTGE